MSLIEGARSWGETIRGLVYLSRHRKSHQDFVDRLSCKILEGGQISSEEEDKIIKMPLLPRTLVMDHLYLASERYQLQEMRSRFLQVHIISGDISPVLDMDVEREFQEWRNKHTLLHLANGSYWVLK